jgi:hypothetical protein
MSLSALSLPGADLQRRALLGNRMQLGFVVEDMDAALDMWHRTLDIGPFVVIENAICGRTVMHRGERSDMEVALGFGSIGDVQIELIQQLNDAPSIYSEFLASGREGLHHVGYWPDDFDRARKHLEQSGFSEVSCVLDASGGPVVMHFEAPASIGSMVELVPESTGRRDSFKRMQRLAQSWDGVRPVRRFETMAAFLGSSEGASELHSWASMAAISMDSGYANQENPRRQPQRNRHPRLPRGQ